MKTGLTILICHWILSSMTAETTSILLTTSYLEHVQCLIYTKHLITTLGRKKWRERRREGGKRKRGIEEGREEGSLFIV
jgi:hypothetical protein